MQGYFVKKVRFHAGSSEGAQPFQLTPTPVTVLVGPNNSGKSLSLREIESTTKTATVAGSRVVAAVDLALPTSADTLICELEADACEHSVSRLSFIGLPGQDSAIHLDTAQLRQNFVNAVWLRAKVGSVYTMRLDGSTRLRLTDKQASGDLLAPARNHLHRLFQDSPRRTELKSLIFDAFGMNIVIDPTAVGHLRLRLSTRCPADEAEEQGWDQRSRDFHRQAIPIEEMSDGVKAFTGILAAVLSSHRKVVLLDEPEAFLHPPLARKLGRNLARAARLAEKNLFVATHSSQFLLGCVESGVPTAVVRLTFGQGRATVRHLPSDRLIELMRDPLLRSASVIGALFHAGAVVSESDTDRAFYEEINARLQLEVPPRGALDTVFLNAQNKQTVRRIVRPLRSLGIPAAAVVDLDVIKHGGKEWADLLDAAGVPEPSQTALATLRKSVLGLFESRDVDPKRNGIGSLSGADRETCENLLSHLADYGIFIVPRGEVEKWLPDFNITGHGPTWLEKLFSAMGSDPMDGNYVRAGTDDVWAFISQVGSWIANPARRGMPH
jgi:predicted ATPase